MTAGRGSGSREVTVRLRTARKRSNSSARWLERQLNDPYVTEAKRLGWRSRAAFKLIELDDRFHILTPGKRVLDLGAAPGGWTQVAVARCGARSRVVAVDIQAMDAVDGAAVLQLDATLPAAEPVIADALGGAADIVLSDMAPSTIGHAATDKIRILGMAEAAYDLGRVFLAPGGTFVCKLFQGGAHASLLNMLKRDFAQVRHAKPPASRKDSSEIYLVATGFRGEPQ
ncbi:23S rRNA (uridine2552-2'-O)-methyltransferase [Constrictibacter sp. MBR-5]|uniref:RlmE family RNA methyltransferase n=1 Tax=Constrictibacter sp. MBR-5 TaxID=3156467 RepID=UPI0033979A17